MSRAGAGGRAFGSRLPGAFVTPARQGAFGSPPAGEVPQGRGRGGAFGASACRAGRVRSPDR
nr:hypothetical protein StreXyl84_72020 [Streptomyces sp. Xyl84]